MPLVGAITYRLVTVEPRCSGFGYVRVHVLTQTVAPARVLVKVLPASKRRLEEPSYDAVRITQEATKPLPCFY